MALLQICRLYATNSENGPRMLNRSKLMGGSLFDRLFYTNMIKEILTTLSHYISGRYFAIETEILNTAEMRLQNVVIKTKVYLYCFRGEKLSF